MLLRDLNVSILMYMVGADAIYAKMSLHDGREIDFLVGYNVDMMPYIDTLLDILHGEYTTSYKNEALERFSSGWGTRFLPNISWDEIDVLVIVPHHVLHSIPFHAIKIECDNVFLGLKTSVTYSSSLSLLNRNMILNAIRHENLQDWCFYFDDRQPCAPSPPETCLTVSYDVYDENQNGYDTLASTFFNKFPEGIRGNTRLYFKSTLYTDNKSHPSAICIVAHGYHNPVYPDYSGIVLKKSIGDESLSVKLEIDQWPAIWLRDRPHRYLPTELSRVSRWNEAEILTISELKITDIGAQQLVALFCCESGVGQISSGDDYQSFAHQFLKSGASSVLANMWNLNFEFAEMASSIFLDNWLTKRQPKALAWRETLRKMFVDSNELSGDIERWAVMVLYGDWL